MNKNRLDVVSILIVCSFVGLAITTKGQVLLPIVLAVVLGAITLGYERFVPRTKITKILEWVILIAVGFCLVALWMHR